MEYKLKAVETLLGNFPGYTFDVTSFNLTSANG